MSDVDDFVRRNPGVITDEQLVFCHYLERRGLMFCGHFGYENAESKVGGLKGKKREQGWLLWHPERKNE